MKKVEVIVHFTERGTIIPIRLIHNGKKKPVTSSGRHWQDEQGYHILIMLGSDTVKELLFDPSTMQWFLKDFGHPRPI